jgi:RNA polymerase sigma-70 factor (ECF subfamily)
LGSNEWEFTLPAAEPETGETAEDHLLMKQIYKAIQVLPEQSRIVVILRDMQELAYKEISMIVDVPLGTVKSRINRARLKIQQALEEFR